MPSAKESSAMLWVKQVFKGKREFTMWIGASDATLSALGESMDGGTPDVLRSTFLEMLGQVQQGTATVLSNEGGKAISCRESEVDASPGFDPTAVALFSIDLGNVQAPPLIWAVELTAATVLEGNGADPAATPLHNPEKDMAPRSVNRLLDLQLPISVALGRASLRFRDVLKITSGSVIELKKEVGEPVDLVVHGTVVARGDLVLVKGNYAVRITQIVSRDDRLNLCPDQP
jgi:flagellar motor switch protein FliN